MSERRHSDFYAEMRQQEGRTVTFYTKRFTDPEVLAEMPMEALVEEIKRRGYGIIYRGKEDPDFDMEKGLQESDWKYKGRFAKDPGGGDFKGVRKER